MLINEVYILENLFEFKPCMHDITLLTATNAIFSIIDDNLDTIL